MKLLVILGERDGVYHVQDDFLWFKSRKRKEKKNPNVNWETRKTRENPKIIETHIEDSH